MIKSLFIFPKSKQTEPSKSVVINNSDNNINTLLIEEPTDLALIEENFPIAPESSRTKNVLFGTLMALSALAIPTIDYLDKPFMPEKSYVQTETVSNQDKTINCNPEMLAKGGEDDNVIEKEELLSLLDFSKIQSISPDAKTLVKADIYSTLKQVDINQPDAKDKIIQQIQKAQAAIDHYSNKLAETPYVSIREQQNALMAKYISGEEFLDNVDFSKLKRYQDDTSVLKALIKSNIPRIERNEAKVAEKYEKEVEKIQSFIDGITKKYEMRSQIAGNDNYDEVITHKEFQSLLDTECLHDLPKDVKAKLLENAMKNYHTIFVGELHGKKDIKEKNQQIFVELQKIQTILDLNAAATQKAYFEMNHKS